MSKKYFYHFIMRVIILSVLLVPGRFCMLVSVPVYAEDRDLPASSVSALGYIFDRDQTSLEIRWTVAEMKEEGQLFSYQVFDKDGHLMVEKQAEFSLTDGRYSDTVQDIDPEMLYRFRVSHTADSDYETVWSDYKTVVPQPVLSPSSHFNTHGELELSWNAVAGADKYVVMIASSPIGNYITAAETSQTSFTVSCYEGHAFEPGTDYYAKIKGVAEDGSSSFTTLYRRITFRHSRETDQSKDSFSAEDSEPYSDEQLQELADSLFEEENKEKSYSDAFKRFLEAAEAGSPVGLYYTGYCYQRAYGAEKNAEKAFTYYKPAAERGMPEAQKAMEQLK